MSTKFMIHYCPGSGGMFLTGVFAKFMEFKTQQVISPVGDCHDLGNGVWKPTSTIDFSHKFNVRSGVLELNHNPDIDISLTHIITQDFIDQHPNIKLIQISADTDDYYHITKMAVKKKWPNIWTEEEYNKWAGADYPPYDRNNIADSELICSDLIQHFIKETSDWFEYSSKLPYFHKIEFKTIMGLNNKKLTDEISSITGKSVTDEISKFVDEYQTLNKNLYFT